MAQTELAAASFDWKYVYVVELLALQDLLQTLPEGEGKGGGERVKFDCPCAADLLAAAVLNASSRYCF
jgi:hypothetical protein